MLLRVYDRRQALAASPKDIRRTTGLVIQELLVKHAPSCVEATRATGDSHWRLEELPQSP
jgi:hypothetical protein